MNLRSSQLAFVRHRWSELLLLCLLAAPILWLRFELMNIVIVVAILLAMMILGYRTDMSTRLSADEDGVFYSTSEQDHRFLAWSEVDRVVPRHFRLWAAEDALVFLDRSNKPLLIASVSMFHHADVEKFLQFADAFVRVDAPVTLSPVSGLSGLIRGERHPELAPERTSERLLASSIEGLVLALLAGSIILLIAELKPDRLLP